MHFSESYTPSLKRVLAAAILIMLATITSTAFAQRWSKRTLAAVRLPAGVAPPVIDGSLRDAAWKVAAHATVFIETSAHQPAPDQTEAWLIYNATDIFIAFRCRDSKPSAIVANESIRNVDLSNDDNVAFRIDTFDTMQWADGSTFTVNAIGTQSASIAGGRADKLEWQGDWQAATKRDAGGWTAEMRIPWRILPYPARAAAMVMGINFQRHEQHAHVDSWWSDLGPEGSQSREGKWLGVVPPLRTWKPRLSLLPYLLPSVGMNAGGRAELQAGLDARLQPTPEITTVATINPDFQSIEGAVASIAFSRSGHFVPDERPFFQEGSDFRNVGSNYAIGPFFDSQLIGRIDAGVNAYGQLSPHTSFSMLGDAAFGSESDLVASFRQNFNAATTTSVLLMQHSAAGADNTVIALTPSWQHRKWGADANLAQSLGPQAGGRGYYADVNFNDTNLFGVMSVARVDGAFLDRLGFIPFTDYQGAGGFTDYSPKWKHGFFRRADVNGGYTWNWHLDGVPFQRGVSADASLVTRRNYSIETFGSYAMFDAQTDATWGMAVGGGAGDNYRNWGINFQTGVEADLPYTSVGPSVQVRLFRHLDLGLMSFVQNYQGVTQQHIFTFNYAMSPQRSWGGRAVWQNGRFNAFLQYHNAGGLGTNTYVILGDPNATAFVPRLMLKLVFAIR
ncbi:MAG: carbohydrate binding family 9 domain-containing protein [Armatimonadetes bacterium]|nr:carbohydrate binding family 9 domain-containing protein [Armatimonadota bacterium]MDE2206681.1 carbohydrate binding family 9 domain-containing protein [Armatimonadota bacterium]